MRYRQNTSVETTSVGDRVVLYETITRKAIVLNPTGAWLWQQLHAPRRANELAQLLQLRYASVPLAILQADVEACLRDLNEQKLLCEDV